MIALGDGAVRLALPAGANARAVLAALRALPGVRDAVVSEVHVAVYFDGARPPAGLEAALGAAGGSSSGGQLVRVRARYDGPDLGRVASWAGMGVDEVVARHSGREYTVKMIGFMPGFAYLGDVDPGIAAPRLPSPRARVPAGAIGIAGGRTAIYPLASPGGWSWIASTDFVAFDLGEGARLRLGDRVRFEAA